MRQGPVFGLATPLQVPVSLFDFHWVDLDCPPFDNPLGILTLRQRHRVQIFRQNLKEQNMLSHSKKTGEIKSRSVASAISQDSDSPDTVSQFVDNRPRFISESLLQKVESKYPASSNKNTVQRAGNPPNFLYHQINHEAIPRTVNNGLGYEGGKVWMASKASQAVTFIGDTMTKISTEGLDQEKFNEEKEGVWTYAGIIPANHVEIGPTKNPPTPITNRTRRRIGLPEIP